MTPFASILKVPVGQPPIKAEPDFNVGGLVITNSMLASLLVVLLVVLVVPWTARHLERRPSRFQAFLELAIGGMYNFAKDSAGETGARLFPLFAGLLFYLLMCNWIALVPGFGQLFVGNGKETWPLLRGVNADYNATLALALMTFTLIHFNGFRARKLGHLMTYVNIPALFGVFFRQPRPERPVGYLTGFLQGIIDVLVGFFELIGEFAKILSLSVRLFANVYGGEMLIAIILGLLAPLALPFIGLEFVIVAVVQAFIFGLLTIIYISLVAEHGEQEAEHEPA